MLLISVFILRGRVIRISLLGVSRYHLASLCFLFFFFESIHCEVSRLIQFHDSDHTDEADNSCETGSASANTCTSSSSGKLCRLLDVWSTWASTRTKVNNGIHDPTDIGKERNGGDYIKPEVKPEPVVFSHKALQYDFDRKGCEGNWGKNVEDVILIADEEELSEIITEKWVNCDNSHQTLEYPTSKEAFSSCLKRILFLSFNFLIYFCH